MAVAMATAWTTIETAVSAPMTRATAVAVRMLGTRAARSGGTRRGAAGAGRAHRENDVPAMWTVWPMRLSERAERAIAASSQVAAVRVPSGRSATIAVRTGRRGSPAS